MYVDVDSNIPLLGYISAHIYTYIIYIMHIYLMTRLTIRQFFNLTVTASVTSIMVEAREASNSFNSLMPHVGTFSLDGSSELKIICDGVRIQMV